MQTWLVITLAASRLGPVAHLQSTDREVTVAVQAMADDLKARSVSGTILLYHKFGARTEGAPEFGAWLDTQLSKQFRARIPDALFHDYWAANKRSRALPRVRDVGGVSVRLVKHIDEKHLPSTGGIYSVSRVGFTAQGDSALVSVSFACRGLCGSDQLYLYVLLDGHWTRRLLLRSLVS